MHIVCRPMFVIVMNANQRMVWIVSTACILIGLTRINASNRQTAISFNRLRLTISGTRRCACLLFMSFYKKQEHTYLADAEIFDGAYEIVSNAWTSLRIPRDNRESIQLKQSRGSEVSDGNATSSASSWARADVRPRNVWSPPCRPRCVSATYHVCRHGQVTPDAHRLGRLAVTEFINLSARPIRSALGGL